MRIAELLQRHPDEWENSDPLLQRISYAFTRHGELKGLLDLGHVGSDPPYDESMELPQPDEGPAIPVASTSLTSVPDRDHAAVPRPARIEAPDYFADPIERSGGGR